MKEKAQNQESLFAYVKKQKGAAFVVIIALVGLLLLVMPEKTDQSSVSDQTTRLNGYEYKMETKIADLCSSIKGVSSVKVNVYFNSGFESVYAFDEESKSTSNGLNSEKKYVTLGSGNQESMVCLYERMPSIAGVAIVCKGGGNSLIANEIINLISSAFEVPKNKIYVTEGKN